MRYLVIQSLNRYIFSLVERDVVKDAALTMRVMICTVVCPMLVVSCSSPEQSTRDAKGTDASQTVVDDQAQAKALQHFVDGSLYESQGEYAKAVLEYQDALRYDKNHAVYFALSKCYSHLGKHTLAIETGREAVRLVPENLLYRRTLADAFIAAYELDSAAAQYEEIVQRDSNNIDSWYGLARLYQTRKPLKALETYERILERFGDDWDVLLQVAQIYESMGRFDKAAGALKQMSAVDPGNLELKRSLAQTYNRAGKLDDALAVYKDVLEVDPGNVDYQLELAAIYLAKKEYATAAAMFENILADDSVNVEVKLRIGEAYFGQIETDSTVAPLARSLFERIRDQHPDEWRSYWFLGAIGAITKQDSLSLDSFRKVTELASWNADGWVYLSSVFFEKNNYDEVVTILESALKVLPDDFRVNFFLGVAYNRLKRNVDAARVLEHARTVNSKDINTIVQLALVYDALGKPEESDKLYEEALVIDPENHLILNNYGYSLAERNMQIDRAYEMARKAVEAQPDNASYLDTMGWVYYRLGKYKEAEEYVRGAIDKGEVNAVVYEHLGDIYYKMNDVERALEQWNVALKIDAGNEALRQKIARGSL